MAYIICARAPVVCSACIYLTVLILCMSFWPSLPFFFDVVSAPLLWSQTLPKPPYAFFSTLLSDFYTSMFYTDATASLAVKRKNWPELGSNLCMLYMKQPECPWYGFCLFLSITLERKWNSKMKVFFFALSAGVWIVSIACSGAEFELHYISCFFFYLGWLTDILSSLAVICFALWLHQCLTE